MAFSGPRTGQRPCDLLGEDFLVGPGGYTSREFEGESYVPEEQHIWTSDFAYCAIHRLVRVLAVAESHGVSAEVLEKAMRHAS